LWKKSGFHEVGRSPEEYVALWREMLFEIPISKPDTFATWYIVINSTEELFFDETAPYGVKNMQELLNAVTSGKMHNTILIRSFNDLNSLDLQKHKLIVTPVFNTTQQKGEGRREIKRLAKGNFEKLIIWDAIDKLLS